MNNAKALTYYTCLGTNLTITITLIHLKKANKILTIIDQLFYNLSTSVLTIFYKNEAYIPLRNNGALIGAIKTIEK